MRIEVSPHKLDAYAKVGMCSQRRVGLLLGGLTTSRKRAVAVARVSQREESQERSLHLTALEILNPLELQLPNDQGFLRALLRTVEDNFGRHAAYLLTIKLCIFPEAFQRARILTMQQGDTVVDETRIYEVFVEDLDRCIPIKKRKSEPFKTLSPRGFRRLSVPSAPSNPSKHRLKLLRFEREIFETAFSNFEIQQDLIKKFGF